MLRFVTKIVDELPAKGNDYMIYKVVGDSSTTEYVYQHGEWVEIPDGGGSGIPDPTELADGTALVKVGDEWKAQDGYGYDAGPAFETIEWDGDTEGLPYDEEVGYKVSDQIIDSIDKLIGGFITYTGADEPLELTPEYVTEVPGVGYTVAGLAYILPTEIESISPGVYFDKIEGDFITKLEAPMGFKTIDPKLLPKPGIEDFVINFSSDGSADKEYSEFLLAAMRNKNIVGYFPLMGGYKLPLKYDVSSNLFYMDILGTVMDSGSSKTYINHMPIIKPNGSEERFDFVGSDSGERSYEYHIVMLEPFDTVIHFDVSYDGSDYTVESDVRANNVSGICTAWIKGPSNNTYRRMEMSGGPDAYVCSHIDWSNNALVCEKISSNGTTWSYSEKRYTLTPAT